MCVRPEAGDASLSITFSPSGRVSQIKFKCASADYDRACIERLMREVEAEPTVAPTTLQLAFTRRETGQPTVLGKLVLDDADVLVASRKVLRFENCEPVAAVDAR